MWRANCNIQLVIDHHACLLAKYERKVEKISSVARNAIENAVGHVTDNSSRKSVLQISFS